MKLDKRFKLTFIFLALIVVLAGYARPYLVPTKGLSVERFWALKFVQKPQYDTLLLGDSRVYRGVSPAAMKEIQNTSRVYNYGFAGVALNREYLDSALRLLDENSENKTLVIGVSPHALTKHATEDNRYLEYKKKHPFEIFVLSNYGDILQFAKPFGVEKVTGHLRGRGYYQTYYADGWTASKRIPAKPDTWAAYYKKAFTKEQISEEVTAELFDFVKESDAKNIDIYGFFPPVSDEVYAVESRLSGLDEQTFRDSFLQAGGKWIFIHDEFFSDDGSHLRNTSAVQFSKYLSTAMLESPAQAELSLVKKRNTK